MSRYTPSRGDIIHLHFDPAAGREMKGNHYALVLSPREFNATGFAMVCPISQGAGGPFRAGGFLVALSGSGTRTAGNVHAHQLKSLDWRERQAAHVEAVPEYIVDEVMARIATILPLQDF